MSTWIAAKLVDGALQLTIYGSKTYMDDDEVHRTRDVTVSINLLDIASVRSAQATLAPLTRAIANTPKGSDARNALDKRRETLFPELDSNVTDTLIALLEALLTSHTIGLENMLRIAARNAERAAYESDAYDENGEPIVVEEQGLSGAARGSV